MDESQLKAKKQRIGALSSWADVVGTFFFTQELFAAKLVHGLVRTLREAVFFTRNRRKPVEHGPTNH